MFHQVALLSGTREGVKALLEELDPALLARPPAQPASAWAAAAGLPLARGAEDGDEEQALRILFGPEFARAYALVMGGQLSPAKAARPNTVSRTAKKPA